MSAAPDRAGADVTTAYGTAGRPAPGPRTDPEPREAGPDTNTTDRVGSSDRTATPPTDPTPTDPTATATPVATPPPAARGGPRVLRRRQGAVVAGVAGGVADHLGVDVLRVRLVITLLVAAGGAGFLAYGALWLFCPLEPRGVERTVPPRERQQGLALATLGVGLALALSALSDHVVSWVAGPLGVALVGVALVWREADTGAAPAEPAEPRQRLRRLACRAGLLRVIGGALLVAGGIAAFLLGRVDLSQLQFGLLAAVATLTGVVVLTVPWWLRLVRELGAERRARIRGQERADIAAHLHDSVLQTLALIQRQAGEDVAGREVRRLARSQERELRAWLYGPLGGDGGRPASATTLAGALAAAAGEVEDDYGLRVAPVVVGDAALDPDTTALVAAAREAMVNAAKHAGVDEVDVYAEVEPDVVEVYVRDRGAGFDPEAVPDDRRGLAGSVRDRMTRHGGRVRLRSAPGEGTEVGLVLPRTRRGPTASSAGKGAETSTETSTATSTETTEEEAR